MDKNRMDSFILLMYGAIIVFFAYKIFKSKKNRGLLQGEISEFKRKVSPIEIGLLVVLLATGAVNLYMGIKQNNFNNMAQSAVMIVLAIIFGLFSQSKLCIGENGILANSNFYDYKQLKKWGFDTSSSDLVMQVKTKNQLTNESVRVTRDDIQEINNLIRKYKLNK